LSSDAAKYATRLCATSIRFPTQAPIRIARREKTQPLRICRRAMPRSSAARPSRRRHDRHSARKIEQKIPKYPFKLFI